MVGHVPRPGDHRRPIIWNTRYTQPVRPANGEAGPLAPRSASHRDSGCSRGRPRVPTDSVLEVLPRRLKDQNRGGDGVAARGTPRSVSVAAIAAGQPTPLAEGRRRSTARRSVRALIGAYGGQRAGTDAHYLCPNFASEHGRRRRGASRGRRSLHAVAVAHGRLPRCRCVSRAVRQGRLPLRWHPFRAARNDVGRVPEQ